MPPQQLQLRTMVYKLADFYACTILDDIEKMVEVIFDIKLDDVLE